MRCARQYCSSCTTYHSAMVSSGCSLWCCWHPMLRRQCSSAGLCLVCSGSTAMHSVWLPLITGPHDVQAPKLARCLNLKVPHGNLQRCRAGCQVVCQQDLRPLLAGLACHCGRMSWASCSDRL